MDPTINPDHSCRERQAESALLALLDAYRELRYSIHDGCNRKYLLDQCHEIDALETAHNRAVLGERALAKQQAPTVRVMH